MLDRINFGELKLQMAKNPEISIIIPVYNVEKYLQKCIESILKQTFQDFEIICIDDGSTDKSLEILEQYTQTDKRFVVIHQKHQGAGDTRNRGIQEAKGKYIQFLDADDYFDPLMLEELYNHAEKFNADLVVCSARKVDENGKIIESGNPLWPINLDKVPLEKPFSRKDFPNDIFSLFCVVPWNKLYLKRLITENNIKFQNISSSNDVAFGHIVQACAERIIVFNQELINYRYNRAGSIQKSRAGETINIIKAGLCLEQYLIHHNLYDELGQSCKEILKNHIRAGISLCNNEEYTKFVGEVKKMFPEDWQKYSSELKKDITPEFLNKFIGEKKVVLWGASLFLRSLLKDEKERNPNILGIIDRNTALQGTSLGNYEIYAPEALEELKPDAVISTIYNDNEAAYYSLQEYLSQNFPNIVLLDNIFINPAIPRNYCPYCDNTAVFNAMGSREHARCPICNSVERHRFLYFVYQIMITKSKIKQKVLHTAPEKSINKYFKDRTDIDYNCIDLNPRYKYAPECQKMDILNLQYPDNVFDYIISNHVLEHIEDEKRFFSELLRVLKPTGKIILSVPYFIDTEVTFEDSSITTPEKRKKFYGQSDHVRKYGRDIFARLAKYGKVTRIDRDFMPKHLVDEMALSYCSNVSDAVIIMEKE